MNKEEILNAIANYKNTYQRNYMGCSEDWYNFVYAMKETFSIEDIENMSEKEITQLYQLHTNVAEGLY